MFNFLKKKTEQRSHSPEEIRKKVADADCLYFGKNGYTIDKQKAFSNYEIAAKNGDVYSQLMVGYMYDYGDGVLANVSKAIEWYTKASESGNENATLNLANIYLLGRNTSVDKQKGISLIQKAAKQGSAIAASSLGREYTIGDVLPKSIEDAAYWISVAETKGYINCQTVTNLGLMYDSEKMYEKAFECFSKAVDVDPNDTNAQYLYAQYKFYGKGTQVDIKDAKMRLERVVKQDPHDLDAKDLLQVVILKETLVCALDITLPVLKNEYQIWDFNLGIFVGDWGLHIPLSFCGSNYQNSECWDDFNVLFSRAEKPATSNYGVAFDSRIFTQKGTAYNLSMAKNILFSLKDIYPHIKVSDCGNYLTATWRLE